MQQGKFEATWQSLAQYETPQWFKDAKFGIWAHWGPQCQPMYGDWYARNMYYAGSGQNRYHVEHYGDPATYGLKEIARDWKAEHWDPEALIKLYKECGAEYFMALANHHDNIDLWDSPYQEWNSVRLGPQRDLLEGWCKAARKQHIPFGISIHASHAWSWLEPSQDYDGKLTAADGAGQWWEGLDPQKLYVQNHPRSEGSEQSNSIHRQWTWGNGVCPPSEEFITNVYNRTLDAINKFDPDVIYFDDVVLPFYPYDEEVGLKIAAHFYNHNARVHHGQERGVLLGKSLNAEQKKCLTWDVERGIPDKIQPDYWQTCTCIGQWHYDLPTYERGGYKTAATVIHMLVDIISKNGNLLLSVPLRPDGTPDEKELAVLHDLAAWMKVNGESIHGTRVWNTFGEGPTAEAAKPVEGLGFNEGDNYTAADVRYVTRGNIVYATLMGWPTERRILLKAFAAEAGNCPFGVRSVKLLGYGRVPYQRTAEGLEITLPAQHGEEPAIVFRIGVK
jgi:alpha-L-fucosidase